MHSNRRSYKGSVGKFSPRAAAGSVRDDALRLPACPGCGLVKNDWPGEGYTHQGESYCCQGCAEGTGCTCRRAGKPGFSREGQKRTRAAARPGEQRAGAPAPQGELSGERDALGTAEGLDEPECSRAVTRGRHRGH